MGAIKLAGKKRALEQLGLAKEAGIKDWLLQQIPLSQATGSAPKRDWLRFLIGKPESILNPWQYIKEIGSLKPTKKHLMSVIQGPGLWEKAKGLGRLTWDLGGKGFTFGFPAYGVYKGLTTEPLPGESRGEAVGRAIGEGLGWLPPMGVVGTAATLATPEYTLPGATSWLGGKVGRGIENLIKTPVSLEKRND